MQFVASVIFQIEFHFGKTNPIDFFVFLIWSQRKTLSILLEANIIWMSRGFRLEMDLTKQYIDLRIVHWASVLVLKHFPVFILTSSYQPTYTYHKPLIHDTISVYLSNNHADDIVDLAQENLYIGIMYQYPHHIHWKIK